MASNKLGGYLLGIGALIASVEFLLGEQSWFRTPSVLGFLALTFGTLVLLEHLQRSSGEKNALLSLSKVLILVGWGAIIFSIGMSGAVDHTNKESVNAVKSISINLYLTVGALGFLGNLIIQLSVVKGSDFSQNSLYKALTSLAVLGSVVMAVLWTMLPHLFEGRDPAISVGTPGDPNFAIPIGLMAGIWMAGIILTAIWAIWTGLILSRKS